ncbi:MAG TPA: hypothetical protein VHE13_11425 [Opitutus sp.]|nr:hypothetical protein [Opitutus sp.]
MSTLETTAPGRLLIVEECLRAQQGHQAGFVGSLVEWGTSLGWDVEVWAHQGVDAQLLPAGARVRPVFEESWLERWWRSSRWQRAWLVLRHNRDFLRSLRRAAATGPRWSLVVATDANILHLFAWRIWAAQTPADTRFVLLSVQPPWLLRHISPAQPARPLPLSWLYWPVLRWLAPLVRTGRCRLAADSESAARMLRRLGGCTVAAATIPIRSELAGRLAVPPPGTASGVRLGFLGRPTLDRGFDRFLGALELWCRDSLPRGSRLRFVVQWREGHGTDAAQFDKLRALAAAAPDAIEIVRSSLDDAAYVDLLTSLHGGVIPSQHSDHGGRPSNVATELTCAGRPFIATRGTLIADQMSQWGAGVACDETATDLAAAFVTFERDYAHLAAQAWARRQAAQENYSWHHFAVTLGLPLPASADVSRGA